MRVYTYVCLCVYLHVSVSMCVHLCLHYLTFDEIHKTLQRCTYKYTYTNKYVRIYRHLKMIQFLNFNIIIIMLNEDIYLNEEDSDQ